MGHPDGPINLERVSHMITNLEMDGENVKGKAKIMDTPYGKIVKNLMDEGATLDVSSRGMGSPLNKGKMVLQKCKVILSYLFATAADIVADPSATDAFVNGVMESKEWVWDNGIIKEVNINSYKKAIQNARMNDLEKTKLKVFENFLAKL